MEFVGDLNQHCCSMLLNQFPQEHLKTNLLSIIYELFHLDKEFILR